MRTTRGMRLHIGIFGRKNAGKSSLLNALTRQHVSIVSSTPGTTTDPVEKPMEFLPIGPVLFIDTAGIDDKGALGELRVEGTRKVFDRTDLALIVVPGSDWGAFEERLLAEFRHRGTPVVVALNKLDLGKIAPTLKIRLEGQQVGCSAVSCTTREGLADLRHELLKATPSSFLDGATLVSDLVPAGQLAIFVVPVDSEAPKGRLILPQVQAIRDLLDGDAMCIVVKEKELKEALNKLKDPPALVVTDSQAFALVSAIVPPEVPMTSFSILFSRLKGDLTEFVQGAVAIEKLRPGDRILMAEACTHHPSADDIGRVKIPKWLNQYVGGELEFETHAGHDFPYHLDRFNLAVHCGSCMSNRREVLSRIDQCREAHLPITNYGMCIAYTLGIFDRALAPFPGAQEVYHRLKQSSET